MIPGRTDIARRMPVHAKLTERSNDGAKSLKSMGIILEGETKKENYRQHDRPKAKQVLTTVKPCPLHLFILQETY